MTRHFLDITDYTSASLGNILSMAKSLKTSTSDCLKGKSVGMIFEKPSNRTRLSFDVGVAQLGGHSIMIRDDEVQLGRREPVSHVARVLSRYVDMIVYRTTDHKKLVELAAHSSVPVINGLSDVSHPCQAMADIMTMMDHHTDASKIKLAYVGDGNNVCLSLMQLCDAMGISMTVVCPDAYLPTDCPSSIKLTTSLSEGLRGATVIYTDVWVSMGDEAYTDDRLVAFKSYQVNEDAIKMAADDCIFMHCLPANLDQEVTESVIESVQSRVFDQAENRLHAQKGIMAWLIA